MYQSAVRVLALAAAIGVVGSCHNGGPDPTSSTEDAPRSRVVARFGHEEITSAEVDARILTLPTSERPRPGDDLEQWYADQIRATVVDRCLLREARSGGLENGSAFQTARREAEKQIGLQLCLADLHPGLAEPAESDLRAAFEARTGELSMPERRSVYQIFLRRKPGAQERIESLRKQVLAGDGFSRLASERSESETRHRGGFVGWMVPGMLPRGFEDVVFGLDEGVPSEVVATREGYHLFLVDQVLPAKSLSFEEARPILVERLEAERTEAIMAELDAGFDAPAGSLVLDRKGLADVMRTGDPQAPVLELGDEQWTLADLQRKVRDFIAHQAGVKGAPTFELPWQIVDRARRREELYLGCQGSGHIPSGPLASRLDAWQERALVDAERQRRLLELALENEDDLRLFYDSNIGEYSTPPTWKLRVLEIPLGDRPEAVMQRLETVASTQECDLDALAAEFGGTIEDLGPRTLAETGLSRPKLPSLVAPLEVGQLTSPYRTENGLEIAELVARTESSPIPFAEVRQRVAARYVQQYTAELYERLSDEILRGGELSIDPDAAAELRRAGLPQPEISVDELVSLIESR